MGVTCSLLGHAFEEADTERERTEQGSEAVTVIREIEECRRCGESRVTSESKEVTSILSPEEVAAESEGGPEPAVTAADVSPDPDGDESPLDFDAADDTEFEPTEEPPADPAEEDAEILSEEPTEPTESATREPGQWPEEPTTTTTMFDPDTLTGGEPTPDEPADEGNESDGLDEEPVTTEPEPAATSILDGEYVCSECGFATPMDTSSLREGDACPSCHRGYLDAR
ncbi:MAG: hypothetical protein U5K28_01920 [Halobacteriales archaeon]|nr:hypothetical protein [Halobacteriales archaeon]